MLLNIHTPAQAKKTARALEKALARKGVTLAHGAALETLATMAGFEDWNAFTASMSEEAVNALLNDFELSHYEHTGDEDYGQEVALVAHTGFQLRYSATDEECDYVRVCDPLGRELMYWNQDEWRDDPAVVMGAILGALVRGEPEVVKRRKSRMKQPSKAASARIPSIRDLNFDAVHAVIFGGSCYNLEWREEDALAWLGRKADEDYEDWEYAPALRLHREEDGLVWNEELTVGQLDDLTWNAGKRCFVDSHGVTYQFFLSMSVADAFDGLRFEPKPTTPIAPVTPATSATPVSVEYRLYRMPHAFKPEKVLRAAKSVEQAVQSAVADGVVSDKGHFCEEVDSDLFGPYLVHVNGGFYNEFESLNKAVKVAQGLLDADEDLDYAEVMTPQGTVVIRLEA